MAEDERASGGGEAQEGEGGFLPGGPPVDPSAASLAILAALTEPTLARRAAEYFDRQTRFVATQTEHMHEQREILVSSLRIRRINDGLRVVSQTLFVLAGLLVCVYFLVLFHDAITSRAIVVEPFETPPALASGGISGRVLAARFLDRLLRLQAEAESTIATHDLTGAWGSDVELEVPETGISFGEVARLLKRRLSDDIHISGDLVASADGKLALTVRGDGVLPKTVEATAVLPESLAEKAAEYVYGETEPARFALALEREGRESELIVFARRALATANTRERAWLLNALSAAIADTGGSLEESLSLELAALKLKPDYWPAYGNALTTLQILGREEEAWQLGQRLLAEAGGRPGRASELTYATPDFLTFNLLAARAALIEDQERHAGSGSMNVATNATIATLDVDLHDADDLAFRQHTLDPKDPYSAAVSHYIAGRLALAAGDFAAGVRAMEAYGSATEGASFSGGDRSFHCEVGNAEALAGNRDRAEAEFRAGGHIVACATYRAEMLARSGDPGASRAFAEAVAVAPDLPLAYQAWGEELLREKDYVGAAQKFAQAAVRGPHWADPYKRWADILATQGRWSEARAKYDEALRWAPTWAELKAARAAAAAHLRS